MPRLIWVFPGCTLILLVLSWGGSNAPGHKISCNHGHIEPTFKRQAFSHSLHVQVCHVTSTSNVTQCHHMYYLHAQCTTGHNKILIQVKNLTSKKEAYHWANKTGDTKLRLGISYINYASITRMLIKEQLKKSKHFLLFRQNGNKANTSYSCCKHKRALLC